MGQSGPQPTHHSKLYSGDQLWDKHMRPDWRGIAETREAAVGKPREEEEGRETGAELRERIDEAQLVIGDEARLGSDEADYVVIRRQVPVRKGKWRMVSKEVEETESEE